MVGKSFHFFNDCNKIKEPYFWVGLVGINTVFYKNLIIYK